MLRPKLGQHFLVKGAILERIAAAACPSRENLVIEIGPGRGALTERLLQRADRVVAVEVDPYLVAHLRARFAGDPRLQVVHADVLEAGLAQWGRAPVVGNLPYYITSPILMRLFRFHDVLTDIVIMVQKEVADRIAAKPSSRDYGLLSATAQLYTKVEKLFTLPPGAFSPPPKVHSTVLRLVVEPQLEKLKVPGAAFEEYLKVSFGQKRKTLANNLRERYSKEDIANALSAAGVKADARAEAIPLAKAAAVFRNLQGAD